MKQVQQQVNGNVENMVAGDQHIHVYSENLDQQQRYQEIGKMRTELLYYHKQGLTEVHNLLCDYVTVHFGRQKIIDLDYTQLQKLYQYYQQLKTASAILRQHPRPNSNLLLMMKGWVNFLKRKLK